MVSVPITRFSDTNSLPDSDLSNLLHSAGSSLDFGSLPNFHAEALTFPSLGQADIYLPAMAEPDPLDWMTFVNPMAGTLKLTCPSGQTAVLTNHNFAISHSTKDQEEQDIKRQRVQMLRDELRRLEADISP